MDSSIWVRPMRLRRKRNKAPKVTNFSSVLEGIEAGMHPLLYFLLFYTESLIFERFVEFCQIKTNYANGWMLEWEHKSRRALGAILNRPRRCKCHPIVCFIKLL